MGGIGKVAKAVYAGVLAGLTGLGAVLVGDAGLGDLTTGQWVAIVTGVLIAGGGVYGIRNAQ